MSRLDLCHQVALRCAHGHRASPLIGPRLRVEARLHTGRHQHVIAGVKLHGVNAVAQPVEDPKGRLVLIGQARVLVHLGASYALAEVVKRLDTPLAP